jgi:hypothetical protein
LPWAPGDVGDDRVIERAAVTAVAVEGDPTDRRPGLREDAVLGTEVLHVSLREVGVGLDLVDRRHHRRVVEKRGEVFDHEVADPDRADLAGSEQRLQGAVGLEGPVKRRRQGLVQISRSIWSMPSLRALFSKPCSVSSYR